MEKQITETNIQHEGKSKEMYNRPAYKQDSEFICEFFGEARNKSKQKLHKRLQQWKESGGNFDKMWEDLKRDMLTKQEN